MPEKEPEPEQGPGPEPELEPEPEPGPETLDEPVIKAEDITPKFNLFGDNNKNAQALEAKVEKIIMEYEKEENSFLRAINAVRIKMLIVRIENQKQLADIKTKHTMKRSNIAITRDSDSVKQAAIISKLELEIKRLEAQIEEGKNSINPKYDPQSNQFMLKSLMGRLGGIDKTLEYLESTDEGKITAQLIRETIEAKRKDVNPELEARLETARRELREAEAKMRTEGLTNAKNVLGTMTTETGLIIAQEGKNIWSTIKNLGKSFIERVGDFFEARNERKSLLEQEAEELARLRLEEEQALKKYIEELRKRTEEKIKETKREYEDKIEAGNEARRKGQAAKFRDDLQHKTNPGEVLPKSENPETLDKEKVVEADGVEPDGVEPE